VLNVAPCSIVISEYAAKIDSFYSLFMRFIAA
jgi:hypothetical protein